MDSTELASCNICHCNLSYKSTSNNLKNHLTRQHVETPVTQNTEATSSITPMDFIEFIKTEDHEPEIKLSSPYQDVIIVNHDSEVNLEDKNNIFRNGTAEQSFVGVPSKKRKTVSSKKHLDKALMLLFIQDFQPFSIVDDPSFKYFVEALNPDYEIPSRTTIIDTLLPTAYDETLAKINSIMCEVTKVTLTVDIFTSAKMDNYLTILVHFVNRNFQMENIFLDCIPYDETQSKEDLANDLQRIIERWNLENKILVIVSNNSAKLSEAIRILKLEQMECFGHRINIVANEALKHASSICEKIRIIVSYFTKNPEAKIAFAEQQIQCTGNAKKLLQDDNTNWNNTYYMLARFSELQNHLKPLRFLNKKLPVITNQDWKFVEDLVEVLEPLEKLTKVLSTENYLPASMVIVLIEGLLNVYQELEQKTLKKKTSTIITQIIKNITSTLGEFKGNTYFDLATFVDPRFKNLGFSDEESFKDIKKYIIWLMTGFIKIHLQTTQADEKLGGKSTLISIWNIFDKKVAAHQPVGDARSKATLEVQRFLDEPLIQRTADPLKWWKENSHSFPFLLKVFLEKNVCVATSVPCESLYSQNGQSILEKCRRLDHESVPKLLFLKANQRLQ